MNNDTPKIKIRETIEVRKFVGDVQDEEHHLETVLIEVENGQVVSQQVIKKGEKDAAN